MPLKIKYTCRCSLYDQSPTLKDENPYISFNEDNSNEVLSDKLKVVCKNCFLEIKKWQKTIN